MKLIEILISRKVKVPEKDSHSAILTNFKTVLYIRKQNLSYPAFRGEHPIFDLQESGVLETNKNKFRFEPKQTETRSVSRLFRETKKKKILFVSVFRTYIETTETNRSVS